MPTCLCTLPPAHTTDEHAAMQAQPSQLDLTCVCGIQPSHLAAQHDAIQQVAPVYPEDFMHANANMLFVAESWGGPIYPHPTDSPIARLWDSGAGMPRNGSTDLSWGTKQVNIYSSKGLKADWQVGMHITKSGFYVPSDSQYAEMMHNIAALGSDKVRSVELWNEPQPNNLGSTITAGIDRLGRFAQIAHPILSAAGIKVVGPSTQGWGTGFFKPFVDKYHDLLDAFSHHLYSGITGSGVYSKYHDFCASQLVSLGKQYGKPVWITEWNIGAFYKKPDGSPVFPNNSVQGTTATDFIRDALRGMRDAGIAETFQWHLRSTDSPLWLVNSSRTALTTAGQAFMADAAALRNGTL